MVVHVGLEVCQDVRVPLRSVLLLVLLPFHH